MGVANSRPITPNPTMDLQISAVGMRPLKSEQGGAVSDEKGNQNTLSNCSDVWPNLNAREPQQQPRFAG